MLAEIVVHAVALEKSWSEEVEPAWEQLVGEPTLLMKRTGDALEIVDLSLRCRHQLELAADEFEHFCSQSAGNPSVHRVAANSRDAVAQVNRSFARYSANVSTQLTLVGMRAQLDLTDAQVEATAVQTELTKKLNRLTWILIVLTALAVIATGVGTVLAARANSNGKPVAPTTADVGG